MPGNQRSQYASDKTWSAREAYLLAMVCLFAGLVLGYLFRGSSGPAPAPVATTAPAPASAPAPAAPSPEALERVVQPMLAMLKNDPKNADLLIQIGNTYYDQRAWPEAIKYYQQALQLRPNEVNVRTDMGTALYYSGFPEKAVAEFEKSLKVQPTHGQTLFNMGIVRRDGLNDPRGAVAAWQQLLETNPGYPQRAQVESLIAQTQGR